MNLLELTLTAWVALSIALSMLFLSGLMFILGKSWLHYIWGVFCVAVAIWAGGLYMAALAHDPATAIFWWKVSFVGMILNPFFNLLYIDPFIDI